MELVTAPGARRWSEKTMNGWLCGAALLVVASALAVEGCTSQHPASTNVQSHDYMIPPQQLAREVSRVVSSPPLSLPVESTTDGTIVTGWQQPFQGDWHIFRYWHERTRYHITVVPDFNDPTHRSHIQVVDETEQRPDESGPNVEARTWHPAPEIHRPQRAQAVLAQIETQFQSQSTTMP